MASFKSKEDFIPSMKSATEDRTGAHHFELYHRLLKLFVDADVEKSGMVKREQFSSLVDAAASIPRQFGFAPPDSEIYKSEQQKVKTREKMFDSMDIMSRGVISFDGWYKFFMDHITAKTIPVDPHPGLNLDDQDEFLEFVQKAVVPRTEEHDELYWYLQGMFMEHDMDTGADGNITKDSFYTMVVQLIQLPMSKGLKCPAWDPQALFKEYAARPAQMSFDEWLSVAIECIFKKL